MENDTVEKTVKSCYDLADNTAKPENYYQANKGKKRDLEYYKNLSEEEKLKKRSYANNRNKNMAEADREKRKKIYDKLLL